MHIPFTPAPGEQIDSEIYSGLPWDDGNKEFFWPDGESQDTFIAWMQAYAPGAVFEFHHPRHPDYGQSTCGSVVFPDDNHATAARFRWKFLKRADW